MAKENLNTSDGQREREGKKERDATTKESSERYHVKIIWLAIASFEDEGKACKPRNHAGKRNLKTQENGFSLISFRKECSPDGILILT